MIQYQIQNHQDKRLGELEVAYNFPYFFSNKLLASLTEFKNFSKLSIWNILEFEQFMKIILLVYFGKVRTIADFQRL